MSNNYFHSETGHQRPNIKLALVKSSQIKSVGYDPATKTMAVQFTRGSGHIYHYQGVSEEEHKEFLAAKSIGEHFGKNFRKSPFEKYIEKSTRD